MSPTISQFPRQRQAAEELFIEQTPWANPQHPIHSQMLHKAQRQDSGRRSPSGPFTPLGQKGVDPVLVSGSASTLPAFPSSSLAPTPMSADQQPLNHQKLNSSVVKETSTDTPSRPPPPIDRDDAAATSQLINLGSSVTKNPGPAGKRITVHSSSPAKSRLSSNLDNLPHSTKSPQRHQAAQRLDEAVASSGTGRIQAQFTPRNNLQASVKVGNS